jgi:hypothetical protein
VNQQTYWHVLKTGALSPRHLRLMLAIIIAQFAWYGFLYRGLPPTKLLWGSLLVVLVGGVLGGSLVYYLLHLQDCRRRR